MKGEKLMLNMAIYTKNTVELNTIIVNGASFKVNDEVAEKIMNLIQSQSQSVSAPTTTPSTTYTTSKSNDKFVDLGTPDEVVDCITVYDKFVRTWEGKAKGATYANEKKRYAIKKAIIDCGAKWNKDKGAYEFTTKKSLNDFLKAQKNR